MASALTGDDLMRTTSSRHSWTSAVNGSFREESNPAFNRSERHDDDEQELRWAAIERLPTYDRMRKGMLVQVLENGQVVHGDINVGKLAMQDKKHLMDNILKVVEEDNDKFLKKLRQRTHRCNL